MVPVHHRGWLVCRLCTGSGVLFLPLHRVPQTGFRSAPRPVLAHLLAAALDVAHLGLPQPSGAAAPSLHWIRRGKPLRGPVSGRGRRPPRPGYESGALSAVAGLAGRKGCCLCPGYPLPGLTADHQDPTMVTKGAHVLVAPTADPKDVSHSLEARVERGPAAGGGGRCPSRKAVRTAPRLAAQFGKERASRLRRPFGHTAVRCAVSR